MGRGGFRLSLLGTLIMILHCWERFELLLSGLVVVKFYQLGGNLVCKYTQATVHSIYPDVNVAILTMLLS